jgi:hypothetical protein
MSSAPLCLNLFSQHGPNLPPVVQIHPGHSLTIVISRRCHAMSAQSVSHPLSAATFVQCELELLMLSGRCNLCPGSIRCACAHRLPTAGSSAVVSRHELRVSAVTPEARRGRALAALSSCVHGSTQWLLGQPGHATVSY